MLHFVNLPVTIRENEIIYKTLGETREGETREGEMNEEEGESFCLCQCRFAHFKSSCIIFSGLFLLE